MIEKIAGRCFFKVEKAVPVDVPSPWAVEVKVYHYKPLITSSIRKYFIEFYQYQLEGLYPVYRIV